MQLSDDALVNNSLLRLCQDKNGESGFALTLPPEAKDGAQKIGGKKSAPTQVALSVRGPAGSDNVPTFACRSTCRERR
jgi:hypothetical protein